MLLLNYLAVSCLFFRILFPANVARADITQEIDSILIGIYEKGYQLGAQFKLNSSASLLFTFGYLDLPIGEYDVGLSKKTPFNISNKGIKLEYLKYFNNDIDETTNFISLGLELSKLKTSSIIKLSELEFDLKPLTLTCRSCKNYLFESANEYKLIPSISIGRQYKMRSRLFLRTFIGVQYYPLPEMEGEYGLDDQLPFYVREELADSKSIINKNIKNLPKIFPTIGMSFTYKL